MSIKSILSVAEAYHKMVSEDSQNNLAATDAAQAQKKQEPMDEIPSWVPGNIPNEKKKDFAEAAKKAYESDNTQFDFDGRVYKITEKLVGNQDKIDVNNNGKIDADDLAKLRGEKEMDEHHFENEVETPGQTQYPGSGLEDTNGNGEIDGEDKAKMPDDEEDSDEGLDEGTIAKKRSDMQRVTHGAMSMADYRAKWKNIKSKPGTGDKTGKMAVPKVNENTELDEAVDYHAAAMKASEHAKSQPSAATHKAASDAHEKAVAWHEKKIAGLIKKDESSEEVKKHEQHIKMHKNEAQKHRFNAHRLKSSVKEGTEIEENYLAVVSRAKANGGYHETGTSDRTIIRGSEKHVKKKAAEYAKGPHRIELHSTEKPYHAPLKTIHVNEGTENPTDKLTLDVPAMIRSLEKAREDFKSDEDVHNFVQGLLAKKDQTIDTNALPTNEALDPKADAGVWIKDFQDSDDPKFAGKSQEERKQQALAAWYAARREAGIKEDTTMPQAPLNENIAGDPHATGLSTKANQASAMAHAAPAEAGAAAHHKTAADAHHNAAQHYRVYMNHAADPVLKRAAEIHHQFHSDMAQHHMLRGVDFSMKEQTVAEGAPADAKAGPEVVDPKTKKMKDDADNNVKAEEAPYTNKADGSENVVPADKPKANPTPMNKLTNEQTLRSVADAYAAMVKSK